MNIARYAKFVSAIVGGIIGAGMAFAAAKGFGTCEVDAVTGAASNCVVFGMSQAQITGFAVGIFSSLGVGFGPANAE